NQAPLRASFLPFSMFYFFRYKHERVAALTFFFLIKNLAFVYPDFNTDRAVAREGRSLPVIYIGAQGLQWERSGSFPLAPGDFRTVQASGQENLGAFDVFALHDTLQVFAHRLAEGQALFQIPGYLLGDIGGRRLGALEFFHVHADFKGALAAQLL